MVGLDLLGNLVQKRPVADGLRVFIVTLLNSPDCGGLDLGWHVKIRLAYGEIDGVF